MISNYIKIALRNMIRRPGFSIINILGLTLGLSVFILVILYVGFEYSFDKFNDNYDNIYRVEQDYGGRGQLLSIAHNPLGPALQQEFPEILNNTRLMNTGDCMLSRESEDKKYTGFRALYVEPSFLEVFTLKTKVGNSLTMLDEPMSIILSEEVANKIYKGENPIGELLTLNSDYTCKVTGIIEDCPKNSQLQYDFLISASTYENIGGEDFFENWNRMNIYTFVHLPDNIDLDVMNEKIKFILQKLITEEYPSTIYLKPLSQIHLYSDLIGDFGPRGDSGKLKALLAIGIFIILIACINFMNMSTAQSVRRAREVGIRKVVGAQRSGLIMQFLTESIIITFAAFLLALSLAQLLLPEYNTLIGRDLSFGEIFKPEYLIIVLGITLLTGILAGSWPAFYLSSYKPVKTLKGINSKGSGSAVVRKFLVVFQFSISVLLIIGTWVVMQQTNYLRDRDPGFDKEGIINIYYHNKDESSFVKFEEYRNELLKKSGVENASISNYIPGFNGTLIELSWIGADEGERAKVYLNFVDTGFINTYGLNLMAGRNFTPEDARDTTSYFIMNESAAKRFRWDEPVGQRLANNSYAVGVVEDFHFNSIKEAIEPIIFYPIRSASTRFSDRLIHLSLKPSSKDVKNIVKYAEDLFMLHFPNMLFEHSFFEKEYYNQLKNEEQLAKTVGYFSILAVFIACLGLLSLSAYLCESRKKEMALRKVMGASVSQITLIFAGEFVKWLLLANIIAWPVAYLIMKRWLEDFPYHDSINWWIFPITALISIALAIGTTVFQSIKSARANPAKVFQYE